MAVAPAAVPDVPKAVPGALAAVPDAIASHDLRALSWWIIRAVVEGTLDARPAAVAVSASRILLSLGPEGATQEEALREAALRGMVMNGVPPRDADEWALAEAIFEPEALEMIRRWKPLAERHHGDVDKPRILGNLARNKAKVARLVDDED